MTPAGVNDTFIVKYYNLFIKKKMKNLFIFKFYEKRMIMGTV